MTQDDRRLADWLRLLTTPQVGRATARRLLEHFGTPTALFQAAGDELTGLAGSAARHLATLPAGFNLRWATTRKWLDGSTARHVLTLDDPNFPALLRETDDPPLLLFAEGRLDLLQRPAIAIVGSRSATAQGRDTARRFAAQFSSQGFAVVSGLALGIDAAAHEGALGTGAGSTIAVVGTGLDQVYPVQHAELATRIAHSGLLLSEFPLGTPPRPEHFPMRNRLIAGLALGTVVVEAALRSGSLITARLAAESGREVFAVPGSIHAAQSRGCHDLLRQGAALVESAAEVVEQLRGTWGPKAGCSVSAPSPASQATSSTAHGAAPEAAAPDRDAALLEALGQEPCTLDQLVERTGLPPATLGARLLELELEHHVARLPGGLFQRRMLS